MAGAAGDDLAALRARFAQPSAVAAALEVESLLVAHGRDAFLSRDAREALKNELRRRDVWFLSEAFGLNRHHAHLQIGVLEVFFGRGMEKVVAPIPFTLGFLCIELVPLSVRNGDADVLELLLNSLTFCDFLSHEERVRTVATATSLLAPYGTGDTIRVLLAHGADVNAGYPETPIYRSNEARPVPTLRYLVDNGVFTVGLTRVLARAAHSTRTTEAHLYQLIRLRVDVNAKGDAVLHVAARSKKAHFVEALFTHGFADVDARDSLGQTPLMRAAAEYDEVNFTVFWHEATTHSIKMLIDLGANVNLQDHHGRTALALAPIRHHYQVLVVLLQHGASPNVADIDGLTPLHRAHSSPPYMFQVTRLLLEYGADARVVALNGKTPLHYALTYSWELLKLREAVELLLQHGADPNATDHTESTPLHILSKLSAFRADIVETLLAHGADLDLPDGTGATCRRLLSTRHFY